MPAGAPGALRVAASRAWRVAWAAPWSLVGLILGALAIGLGARARRVDATLEIAGGSLGRGLGRLPAPLGFAAITFGHVILGRDHATLARLRSHERVHVRQYETWGPLFVPLYLASSLSQWCRGADPYRANRFEREAFEAERGGPSA